MTKFNFPGKPPKEALEYFRAKDLRVGFNYQDVWGSEHAHAFTVAKVAQLDVLDDIRGAVDKALAEGKTFRSFANELKPALQKKGWWGVGEVIDPVTGEKRLAQLGSPRRLKTIYQANMRSARAAGQWQRVQRTKKTHPYLLYSLGPSLNHRDQHVSWAGTLLPVDHPWWQDHYPPNGWGCKCRIRNVSQREADRLGGKTEQPSRNPRKWTNKRTGEQLTVDRGLDPAWSGNPGQDRVRVIREQLTQKVDTIDQRYAQAAVNQIVKSPVLDGWIADPQGELPVGVLSRNMQQALGSQSQVVRLSKETLDKQSKVHAELTVSHYRSLPELINKGVVIRQSNQRLILFIKQAGKWNKAVVKTTGKGDKVYLVSYHKASAKEVRREMDRGEVLRSVPGN